jgi:hypothetical protein
LPAIFRPFRACFLDPLWAMALSPRWGYADPGRR